MTGFDLRIYLNTHEHLKLSLSQPSLRPKSQRGLNFLFNIDLLPNSSNVLLSLFEVDPDYASNQLQAQTQPMIALCSVQLCIQHHLVCSRV